MAVEGSTDAGSALTDWTERAAIGASLACLLHCLALPLLLAALPALSAYLAIPETFHLWVLAFAAPIAAFALLQGTSRHSFRSPLLTGAAGLVLLAVGALGFPGTVWETLITVTGSLALAAAHINNWRLRHDRRARPCAE